MKPVQAGRYKDADLLARSRGGWREWLVGYPVIRLGGYRFQPARAMTLLTLALFLLLAVLGFWQLSRADAKAQLIERFDSNSSLPALHLNSVAFSDPSLAYRQVTAEGAYPNAPLMLLNNQVHQGRIGFHRLRLFRLAESDSYLLINQGWVPATAEGRPMIAASGVRLNQETVRGMLVPTPRVGLRLGELRYQADAPVMELPYLDPAWLGDTLRVNLQPFVLLQDGQLIGQYKQLREKPWLNPERHRGYALQWFSLALALLVIYLVTNLKRPGTK